MRKMFQKSRIILSFFSHRFLNDLKNGNFVVSSQKCATTAFDRELKVVELKPVD